MGDTGSLTIGAIISVIALMIRKELLLPLLCGIFLIENLSVVLQVSYFKYTKKKTGVGQRIFLMSPIHHHYQKKGYHESKIVARFWIVGILLNILTIVTLKTALMKKMVILGAGESGKGTAILAQQKGYEVFVSDAAAIAPEIKSLFKQKGIRWEEKNHSTARSF